MRGKLVSACVLILSCCVVSETPADGIFRWFDNNGTLHLADHPDSVPKGYRNETPTRQVGSSREGVPPAPVPKASQAPVSNLQKFTISLTRQEGRLLVNGRINDHGSVRFIVDTGASLTIIPAGIASRLGFDRNGAPSIQVRGVGGVIDGRLIEIASLKVGHAEARNFDVVVVDDDLRGIGLLGADFLSRFQMHLNYTRDEMVLHAGEGPYEGYPAAWWQEKFRLYRRLKHSYEQRIKQNHEHLRSLGINPGQRNWESAYDGKVNPLRPISDEIKEHEHYLRVLEKKMSDLQLRANRAELPPHFRE